MRVYVQGVGESITKRTVYNMALHDIHRIFRIKKMGWKFLLVHGGFQGKMSSFEDIAAFREMYKPELTIAPDAYKEYEETLNMGIEFGREYGTDNTAAVIQLFEYDYSKLVRALKEYDKIGYNWIAIPSDSVIADEAIVDKIKDLGFKVHLLGSRKFVCNIDSVDIVSSNISDVRIWIGFGMKITRFP